MTKQELKKADSRKLVYDAIRTYGFLLTNEMRGCGTKQLERHFQDCCAEMVKRGIITQDEWDSLNR